jgi:Ca2+-binding RTX toxin-like protein
MRTVWPTLAATVVASLTLAPLSLQAATAPPRCHGVEATIVGTDGRDDLNGTSGRDVVVGLGGWDRIDGYGGDDLICGGSGTDQVRGGPGRDRLYGGPDGRVPDEPPLPIGDSLWGGPGDDRLHGGADDGLDTVKYDTSTSGVTVDLGAGTATGQGHDTLVGIEDVAGSRHDDELRASATTQWMSGLAGDDTLLGGPDVLTLYGGPGADLVRARNTSATGDGGDGNDRLFGGDLRGGDGDDDLTGTHRLDWLEAGDGDDTISGRDGDDYLLGGSGDDTGDGGPGRDECWDDVETKTNCEA